MTAPARPARRTRSTPAPLPPAAQTVTHAALVEYLGARAVIEIVVVEFASRTYRIEASLVWRPGKSVLVAARGDRTFRSLDTVASFLRTTGVGPTLVRLELLT